MRRVRLYLAGPMAFKAETDYNYPEFERVVRILRKTKRFDVVSPHEVEIDESMRPGDRPYLIYVRHTLIQLLTCEAVAVLDEIEQSSGALQECSLARQLKMPVYHWLRWENAAALGNVGSLLDGSEQYFDPIFLSVQLSRLDDDCLI